MANYQFSADLVDDILFRGGEGTDGASDYEAKALQYLNRAYRVLCHGGGEFDPELHEDWWWLKKDPPGVMNLPVAIAAGDVSVTNDSVNITFSSAPASSVAGWHFKVQGHPDVFRIATHTGGVGAATLDAAYTGETAAAAAYKLMKLEHALAADVLKVVAPMRVQAEQRGEIDGVELSALERDWPLSRVEQGVPEQFAMLGEQKVRFNRYGFETTGKLIRVEYDYLRMPDALTNSGSEEPAVPLFYRHVLCDMALFYLYTDKNDDRAGGAAEHAGRTLNAMAQENRKRMIGYSRTMGKIFPRPTRRSSKSYPLRTSSGFIIG